MQRPSNTNRKALDTITRMLCVFALLLVSFAHSVPAASPQAASTQTSVDLSAYALPDGTLPVICHSPSRTDDGGGIVFFSECEFCRLASAAVLPASDPVWLRPCAAAGVPMPAVHGPAILPVHYAGTPTRGPPRV
ncbi:MAG: hypothetical protein AAGA00_15200 [Pseudomonadota bacterium]